MIAFAAWAWLPRVPIVALAVVVVASVVVAVRPGQLEPLLFELSVLAFVVGAWVPSLRLSLALGLLALAGPVIVWLTEPADADLGGVWMLGIAFPWVVSRAVRRQMELAQQLDATRRELAEQALVAQRREIARDVHDLVGHGLAAMMLHVTGARHVLRRDPDAAEEALRAAEEQGRRSMRELRQTLDVPAATTRAVAAPVPTTRDISAARRQRARRRSGRGAARARRPLRRRSGRRRRASTGSRRRRWRTRRVMRRDARTVLGARAARATGAARCRDHRAGSPRDCRPAPATGWSACASAPPRWAASSRPDRRPAAGA